jgi:hypothetical protein
MGLSLTSRGLVDRAVLAVRDLARDRVDLAVRHPVDLAAVVDIRDPVVLADQDLAGPADRVVLVVRDLAGPADQGLARDRVDRVDLAVRHPVGLAVLAHIRDPVVLDLVGLAVPEDQADLAVLGPVDPAVPAGIKDRPVLVDRVVLVRAGRVDLAVPAGIRDRVDLADQADQGMNRVDPVDPVDLGLADRAHRRRSSGHPEVLLTGVAPKWAAPGMRRTASAHPVTVRPLRPHNTDGVGMAGLHPERRRLGGTDRRPRVAGTAHRPPVVGTARGTVPLATLRSRSVISDRSITTGTTPSQCSTRCSEDGASGSSESGFRCTDTTQNVTAFGPCYAGPKAVRSLLR